MMNKQRKMYAILALLIAALLLSSNLAAAQTSDPATDPMPSISQAMGTAYAIVVRVDVSGGTWTESSVEVVQVPPPALVGGPEMLNIQVFDRDGQMVEEFKHWDPRAYSVYDATEDYHAESDAASGRFVLPFAPDMQTMLLYDLREGNQQVASVDLGPAILWFCENHPNDPKCMPDIKVTKTDSPDPVGAGSTLDYTITVENESEIPAQSVQVVDTLPAGVTYVSDTSLAGCVEAPVGTLTCDVGYVGGSADADNTVEFTVTVLVDADLVYNNGGPVTITNDVTATSLAGTDSDLSNNSDSEDTEVIVIADVAIADLKVLEPPFELIIDTDFDITLQTTATNYGPSAPVDAELTRTASASVDASVNPTTIGPDVLVALGLNALRVVEDVFTIRCSAPGPKTFTFESDIELVKLTPSDIDPDLSNNHAEVELVVECVIPVEIDIKPGNPNNPINLGSKGVFQVVIFTNPDYEQYLWATDIDPSTIDLAGAGAQVLGNGRYWTQERDVNRDGYPDLIVHIETEQIVPEELVLPENLLQIEDCPDRGAVLRAATFHEPPIHVRGEDCIRRVPPQ